MLFVVNGISLSEFQLSALDRVIILLRGIEYKKVLSTE
jgi:hypothetical protein